MDDGQETGVGGALPSELGLLSNLLILAAYSTSVSGSICTQPVLTYSPSYPVVTLAKPDFFTV